MNRDQSLTEIVTSHAKSRPDHVALAFLDNRGALRTKRTYAELDELARASGERIARLGPPGTRIAVFSRTDIEGFIVDLLGCWHARAVAVPLPPPKENARLEQLIALLQDASPAAILGGDLPDSVVDRLSREAATGRSVPCHHPDLALIQYTSGSTSRPKGVCISHANILANQRMIEQAFGHGRDEIVLGWLPLFHDMGLIGTVLQPLFLGATSILMSPMAFLMRPAVWLKAISDFRATTSGGPDFAYRHCLTRIDQARTSSLDLSSWRVAFNGSESVRDQTMTEFAQVFAPYGFRRTAFLPCYGLAEATLFVAGGQGRRLQNGQVSCGTPFGDTRIRIVEPSSRTPLGDREVGEIWVQSSSVSSGYWRRENDEAFAGRLVDEGDGRYLRTGDLGFLDRGELFVTGRLKDLWILNGKNVYPNDIEHFVESEVAGIQPGRVAAILPSPETIVVLCEFLKRSMAASEAAAIRSEIVELVSRQFSLRVREVVLLERGGISVTTSGKIRRDVCRQNYLDGQFPAASLDDEGAARCT